MLYALDGGRMGIRATNDGFSKKYRILLLMYALGNQQNIVSLDIKKPKNILTATLIGTSATAVAASYWYYRSFLNQRKRQYALEQKEILKITGEIERVEQSVEGFKKRATSFERIREEIESGDIKPFLSKDYSIKKKMLESKTKIFEDKQDDIEQSSPKGPSLSNLVY
jgi:hypothetical protein